MMSDNRIVFPPTEVDFDQVGTTGQDHDNFPEPGQEARYDWMRLFLIGLLSSQSSKEPPTQFRTGTVWFNNVKKVYFVWFDGAWRSIAETIALMETTDGAIISLADWFVLAQEKLDAIQPRITFSGNTVNNNVTSIPVPEEIRDRIEDVVAFLHPLVYINGLLIDPRSTKFSKGCPSKIELLDGINLDVDDKFTVIVEQFDLKIIEDVIAS